MPGGTSKVTPSSAVVAPQRLTTPVARITGWPGGDGAGGAAGTNWSTGSFLVAVGVSAAIVGTGVWQPGTRTVQISCTDGARAMERV